MKSETSKKYSLKTFGCKVNTYDSALIQKTLKLQNWTEAKNLDEGVHIVNTCAVTDEAVKAARRYIRHTRRHHPKTRIVVTGCAAQVETEKFSSLPEVDKIIANSHKEKFVDILNSSSERTFKDSIFKKNDLGMNGSLESSHSRLFLKIQDGCNSFCTFCIIPFARGKSRSIPMEELIRSVQEHYQQGVREVVLTGVHIGDYYTDSEAKQGLEVLVQNLIDKTNMPRIRLSSLEPPELSEKLLELFSSDRICPHFHMSIQSANSEVLQRMKRKYEAKDVKKTLLDINKKIPHAFVGMDLIAGFAGESQEQFKDTYLRLKDLPWTKIHVFPYSSRRYTYAERAYSTWSSALVKKRARLMRRLSEDRFSSERKKQIGTLKKILPLKKKDQIGIGRDYWTVKWLGRTINPNIQQELSVRIQSENPKQEYLQGHLVGRGSYEY